MGEPLRVLFQGIYHDDHCDALKWLCLSATITPLLWLGYGEAGQLRMVNCARSLDHRLRDGLAFDMREVPCRPSTE